MCVVSIIMDHYREKWEPWVPSPTAPIYPPWVPIPVAPAPAVPITIPFLVPAITKEEIEEFRKLLRRAREYDKRTGQEDCEMEEKKQALKRIAELLGVDISFIDKLEGVPDDARSA